MTDYNRQHNLEHWPEVFVRVPFEIKNSALVIVDMQQYWTHQDGPVGNLLKEHYPSSFAYFYDRLAQTVIPNLAEVLKRYRGCALPIVYITTGTRCTDGRDLPAHLRRRFASKNRFAGQFDSLRVGGKWHQVASELAPKPDEIVLNKISRSPFHSTGIDQLLRNMNISHLLVGGLASNGCVDLTARDAADRGFETFLLEDGCATFTEDAHSPVFRTFSQVFGGVLTVEGVTHLFDATF